MALSAATAAFMLIAACSGASGGGGKPRDLSGARQDKPMPREVGYGVVPRTKNGPALAGYGAVTMKNALVGPSRRFPSSCADHSSGTEARNCPPAQFRVETGVPVFFADPRSPWQRGTNENTNGLLRQYFPKGTDLARWTNEEIQAVTTALNGRPRKTLGWKTPSEAFNEHLLSVQQAGGATIA